MVPNFMGKGIAVQIFVDIWDETVRDCLPEDQFGHPRVRGQARLDGRRLLPVGLSPDCKVNVRSRPECRGPLDPEGRLVDLVYAKQEGFFLQ
jgi:hypothetical protein